MGKGQTVQQSFDGTSYQYRPLPILAPIVLDVFTTLLPASIVNDVLATLMPASIIDDVLATLLPMWGMTPDTLRAIHGPSRQGRPSPRGQATRGMA